MMSSNLVLLFPLLFYIFLRRPILDLKIPLMKSETHKSNGLNDRVQNLEKELTLKEPLAQAKQQMWANIINSVNDIWLSIQVI